MSIFVNRTQSLTPQTPNQVHTDSHSLYNPPQMVSMDIGFVMLFVAICGVLQPTFLGLALSPMHCFVLSVSAVLAIWSGFLDDRKKAFYINLGLGTFFTLNAVAGIILGQPGTQTLASMNVTDAMILKIAPGFLELTSIDHALHGVLTLAFFSEAIAWKVFTRKGGEHRLQS